MSILFRFRAFQGSRIPFSDNGGLKVDAYILLLSSLNDSRVVPSPRPDTPNIGGKVDWVCWPDDQ